MRGHELKIIVSLCVVIIVLPVYLNSQYPNMLTESNPTITFFYSDAQSDSFKYLQAAHMNRINNDSNTSKQNLIVYGYSPWLKVLMYDQYNVYEALDKDYGSHLSQQDKEINQDFLTIVENPASVAGACMLKKFDIDYIYIADNLFQRFYTPHQSAVFYEELNLIRFSTSPFLHLENEFHGDHGERVRIYSVNSGTVEKYC